MAPTVDKAAPAWVRAFAVLIAAAALGWVALVNGQPFFHPDSLGYIRGPDVAVMKLLGPHFATAWSKVDPGAIAQHLMGAQTAAPSDNGVMAGRSIYYGVLAWLGAKTGGFWLTIFIQGLGVAWVAEIILRGLGVRSLRAYAAVMAVITLLTPAPFFVAFLMPDIWAGVGIAAAAALFALAGRLKRADVAVLFALTAFAALAHNSVGPVLLGLMVAGGGWRLVRGKAFDARLGLAGCGVALVAMVAGNLAFAKMVEHTTGRPPVNPPFLTARVIADGTGERFAREQCAGRFVVCRYADRFPMGVDDFLWGQGQHGVFNDASPTDRAALGAEQARFAIAAALAYPVQQITASARNAVLQVVDTDLSDFNYKPSVAASLTGRMPADAAAKLEHTPAYSQAWPLVPLWALQSAVLLASLTAGAWLALRPRTPASAERAPAAELFGFILVGVLANGVVCGVLSTLYGRYEARVVWVIPLAAVALALSQAPQALPALQRRLQPLRA